MSFYWIQHNWSTLGITHVKQEISTMQDNGILSSQSFVSQIILSVIYFFCQLLSPGMLFICLNCPRQQHINNTVCFWPREKFISTSEDTKNKSGKIKRNKPLCHLPCREEIQKQGGWVGEKLLEVEKQCDRFESDRN